jgi:hypothetical protein
LEIAIDRLVAAIEGWLIWVVTEEKYRIGTEWMGGKLWVGGGSGNRDANPNLREHSPDFPRSRNIASSLRVVFFLPIQRA